MQLILLLFVLFMFTPFVGCKSSHLKLKEEEMFNHPSGVSIIQPLACTDALGRTLPLNDDVGDPKKGRQVGIFYFLLQGDGNSNISENYWDLSEIVANHPDVLEDFDNEYWGYTPTKGKGNFYYWGKPIYGYYRGDDYWVHLRSMQLLTDADVDFVVIDATNSFIYPKQSNALMNAMDAIRAQGKNPPKIVYYTNSKSAETMQKVYDNFYKTGAPYYHPKCWYYLDEKPLIIGISNEAAAGRNYGSFFTFRESQWPNEPQKVNGWPWIDFSRPQKVYKNKHGKREIINVSVSQHPNWLIGMGGSAFYGNTDNWGRSYRNGSHGDPENDIYYGYNFQEQWDFALQQDVPYIFITGWNEWVAGRWGSTDDNPEHSWFCDLASPEYSRDAEPTLTSGLIDNYYMQMVSNIRRYKGIAANPKASAPKTIKAFNDWSDVLPVYTDYTNDTMDRNHPGAESKPARTYTNTTGRNDLHLMKVACNEDNLFFYTETVEPITANSGINWMRLYLDIDRNAKTGWTGYDFRVVGGNKLQNYQKDQWVDIATLDFIVDGKKLMITIPFKNLRLSSNSINLEFKWSDNMQNSNDPLDWYVNGDAAPGGRYNFIYCNTLLR